LHRSARPCELNRQDKDGRLFCDAVLCHESVPVPSSTGLHNLLYIVIYCMRLYFWFLFPSKNDENLSMSVDSDLASVESSRVNIFRYWHSSFGGDAFFIIIIVQQLFSGYINVWWLQNAFWTVIWILCNPAINLDSKFCYHVTFCIAWQFLELIKIFSSYHVVFWMPRGNHCTKRDCAISYTNCICP